MVRTGVDEPSTHPGGRNDTEEEGGATRAARAVVAVAAVAVGSAHRPQEPIVIGWAFDSKGAMAPFDVRRSRRPSSASSR